MKLRQLGIWLMLLSFTLLACTLANPAVPPDVATPLSPSAPAEATLPPLAPGTLVPTRDQATLTPQIRGTPSATPTLTATLTPTMTPRPVSTGPLDFTVSIIGCQLDASRQGGVILKMRFDAAGGNGVYAYYRENQRTTRTFDRPATKGTAVIESYRVESGDGQRVDKKERFTGAQFGCP